MTTYTDHLYTRTLPLRQTLRTWLPPVELAEACAVLTTLEYIAECAIQLATATTERDQAAAWVGLLGAVDGLTPREEPAHEA